jgi:hypothetical protein
VTASAILEQLHRLGVAAVAAPNGGLTLKPSSLVPSELLEQVKSQKPAILEWLSRPAHLMPAQSPWLDLADDAEAIWDALQAQSTRTLHLIDQDGRKYCHHFTASKPSDLRELAARGLKTFPQAKRLTVIAVMPEVQVWQLETREVN